MKLKLKFYALYKDLFGEEEVLEVPEGTKVKDVKEIVKKRLPKGYPEPVILVNGRYADDEEPVMGEVHVVPPASGGRGRVLVTEGDFSVDEAVSKVLEEETGAVVVFVGYVKPKGGKVKELVYEVHPDFPAFVENIIEQALKKHGAQDAYVVQFEGPRKVGEKTLIIAVSSETREQAFNAAREILERIKHEAPVWKLEKRVDGEYWLAGDKEIRRLS